MKKSVVFGLSLLLAVCAVFGAVDVFAEQKDSIPAVEKWILIGEERYAFSPKIQLPSGASVGESGLVRRYFVDPQQRLGTGSTISVFSKDGSETLFWRGWGLYTASAHYALLSRGTWYIQPGQQPLSSNMLTLRSLVEWLKNENPETKGKIVTDMGICLDDGHGNILRDNTRDNNKEVCQFITFLY